MTTLQIESIRLDGGTQPRAEVNPQTVEEYREMMAGGAIFPPITVFYDGNAYWLADGFHRHCAAKALGVKELQADVRQGTRREAVLFSVGANAQHGLQRSNADKRRAVQTLLSDTEWSQWSNSEIARRCLVSEFLVRSLRPHFDLNEVTTRAYTTKHGNQATMNVQHIGKATSSVQIGQRVRFEGLIYEIAEIGNDGRLDLRSIDSPNIKANVTASEVEPLQATAPTAANHKPAPTPSSSSPLLTGRGFMAGQRVYYQSGLVIIEQVNPNGTLNLRAIVGPWRKPQVPQGEVLLITEQLALQHQKPAQPQTPPVIHSFPTQAQSQPVSNPATSTPPSVPRPQQSPTQIEIAKKLSDANLHPFRIVAHTNGHSGTFSAGFDSNGTRQEADKEAKTYGEVMQMIGFVVLNAGVDIAPGYQTLSMSGQHTPIVHFAQSGYQMPEAEVTESKPDDGDEWYTPDDVIERVRDFFDGVIDLDPASCAVAQQTVQASVYYDAQQDGLAQDWHGKTWLNPPYSFPLVEQFTEKLIAEYLAGRVTEAIALTNNRTDADWCQQMMSHAEVVCFSRRINFNHPRKDSNGNRQGQIFYYFGQRALEFARAFHDFGPMMRLCYTPQTDPAGASSDE